jgi:hypothetical protein
MASIKKEKVNTVLDNELNIFNEFEKELEKMGEMDKFLENIKTNNNEKIPKIFNKFEEIIKKEKKEYKKPLKNHLSDLLDILNKFIKFSKFKNSIEMSNSETKLNIFKKLKEILKDMDDMILLSDSIDIINKFIKLNKKQKELFFEIIKVIKKNSITSVEDKKIYNKQCFSYLNNKWWDEERKQYLNGYFEGLIEEKYSKGINHRHENNINMNYKLFMKGHKEGRKEFNLNPHKNYEEYIKKFIMNYEFYNIEELISLCLISLKDKRDIFLNEYGEILKSYFRNINYKIINVYGYEKINDKMSEYKTMNENIFNKTEYDRGVHEK